MPKWYGLQGLIIIIYYHHNVTNQGNVTCTTRLAQRLVSVLKCVTQSLELCNCGSQLRQLPQVCQFVWV
jgi:hypothetical protein